MHGHSHAGGSLHGHAHHHGDSGHHATHHSGHSHYSRTTDAHRRTDASTDPQRHAAYMIDPPMLESPSRPKNQEPLTSFKTIKPFRWVSFQNDGKGFIGPS